MKQSNQDQIESLVLRLQDELTAELRRVAAEADATSKRLDASLARPGRAAKQSGDEFNGMLGKLRGIQPGVGGVDQALRGLSNRFSSTAGAAGLFGRAAGVAGLAVVGMGALIARAKGPVMEAGLYIERTQNRLTAMMGGSRQAAQDAIAHFSAFASENGLVVRDVIDAYSEWMLTIQGTSIQGTAGRKIFENLSVAISNLGIDTATTTRAFAALRDMANIGVINTRDFRQLQNNISGARQALEEAVGKTGDELDDMLSKGLVTLEKYGEKFTAALRKQTAAVGELNSDSTQVKLNQLQNSWNQLSDTIWKSGGEATTHWMLDLLNDVSGGLDTAITKAGSLKNFLLEYNPYTLPSLPARMFGRTVRDSLFPGSSNAVEGVIGGGPVGPGVATPEQLKAGAAMAADEAAKTQEIADRLAKSQGALLASLDDYRKRNVISLTKYNSLAKEAREADAGSIQSINAELEKLAEEHSTEMKRVSDAHAKMILSNQEKVLDYLEEGVMSQKQFADARAQIAEVSSERQARAILKEIEANAKLVRSAQQLQRELSTTSEQRSFESGVAALGAKFGAAGIAPDVAEFERLVGLLFESIYKVKAKATEEAKKELDEFNATMEGFQKRIDDARAQMTGRDLFGGAFKNDESQSLAAQANELHMQATALENKMDEANDVAVERMRARAVQMSKLAAILEKNSEHQAAKEEASRTAERISNSISDVLRDAITGDSFNFRDTILNALKVGVADHLLTPSLKTITDELSKALMSGGKEFGKLLMDGLSLAKDSLFDLLKGLMSWFRQIMSSMSGGGGGSFLQQLGSALVPAVFGAATGPGTAGVPAGTDLASGGGYIDLPGIGSTYTMPASQVYSNPVAGPNIEIKSTYNVGQGVSMAQVSQAVEFGNQKVKYDISQNLQRGGSQFRPG